VFVFIRKLFLCSLVLLTGCSNKDKSFIHSFSVFEEDGIEVALTTGGPKYTSPLFEYEPLSTLQEDPDNEESLLFRPREFTVGDDGNYYVNDTGNRRIAVFSSEGRYVRSFGRAGSGPGEFGSLVDIAVHEGIVHIFDSQHKRATRYSCDGTLIDVVTIPPHVYARFPSSFYILSSLKYALVHLNSRSHEFYDESQDRLAVLSSSFDTLWTAETPFVRSMTRTTMSSGTPLIFGTPYRKLPIIECFHGVGIVVSGAVEPELVFYDFDGHIRREVRVELEPVPITEEDRSRVISDIESMVDEYGEEYRDMVEAEVKALDFPPTKPYWWKVYIDDAGYIWLEQYEPGLEEFKFLVLSPRGEYLGDTWIPYAREFNVARGKLMVNWTPPGAEGPELLVCDIKPIIQGFKYP